MKGSRMWEPLSASTDPYSFSDTACAWVKSSR